MPVNWIAADIVRVKDGVLVEHWDLIEDEATQEQSQSGLSMFGDEFSPAARRFCLGGETGNAGDAGRLSVLREAG